MDRNTKIIKINGLIPKCTHVNFPEAASGQHIKTYIIL